MLDLRVEPGKSWRRTIPEVHVGEIRRLAVKLGGEAGIWALRHPDRGKLQRNKYGGRRSLTELRRLPWIPSLRRVDWAARCPDYLSAFVAGEARSRYIWTTSPAPSLTGTARKPLICKFASKTSDSVKK